MEKKTYTIFAQKFILIKMDERLAPKHWMYECRSDDGRGALLIGIKRYLV
ncbi:hypothetical protein KDN24_03400 [Bacillus sp. Bva_UNVM-123]